MNKIILLSLFMVLNFNTFLHARISGIIGGAIDGTANPIAAGSCGDSTNEVWTERSNPRNVVLNGIVWNGDSTFVAVGARTLDTPDAAYIVTSSDGISWKEAIQWD